MINIRTKVAIIHYTFTISHYPHPPFKSMALGQWNLGIVFLGNCASGGKIFAILRGWIFLYFSDKHFWQFVKKNTSNFDTIFDYIPGTFCIFSSLDTGLVTYYLPPFLCRSSPFLIPLQPRQWQDSWRDRTHAARRSLFCWHLISLWIKRCITWLKQRNIMRSSMDWWKPALWILPH